MTTKTNTPLVQPLFNEPVFSEGELTPDPAGFLEDHPSDSAIYKQIQDLLKTSVVSFDKSRAADDEVYPLQAAYGSPGAAIAQQIEQAGKIIFHAVGDTGASNSYKYKNEIGVADQLSMDCHEADAANRPAFLFHLGDVVYDFGEAKYYYDQFFEPFRSYPAPIFAIPGNHDSFVLPNTPADQTPLTIFSRNFCAIQPIITPEAASLHRTAMTQPGVYFTLDAPFVRIIGLFSNALEDPGVISNKSGHWPTLPDSQLTYLAAQLKKIKDEAYKGAVLIAVHHPPFSYAPAGHGTGAGGNHGGSKEMLHEIDTICKEQGVYPHAFLSAHAHNYQRYTRAIEFDHHDGNGPQRLAVPFLVCGDGGHNVNRLVQGRRGQPAQEPNNGTDVSYMDKKAAVTSHGLVLEKYDDIHYGYLRITVDAQFLRIGFHQVGNGSLVQSRFDMVTVDLASHTLVAN